MADVPETLSPIVLKDVAAQRGGRTTVEGVNLTISPGRPYLLRGENGAGKTTLLRVIAGFAAPSAGEICATPDRRAITTFLGHSDGVKLALTGRENLEFWRSIYGASRAQVDQAVDAMRTAEYIHKRAATLSAGQRRRLALCRAILSGRPLWLLDEPTAGMDETSVKAVLRSISRHCASGGAAIVATHEPLALPEAVTITLRAGAGHG